MKSRSFVLLGLLFAVLLLISSTVAEETSKEEKKEVEAKEPNQQYGGGKRCFSGCCGYGPYGRCQWCCRNAAEARAFELAQANSYGESGYYGSADDSYTQPADKVRKTHNNPRGKNCVTRSKRLRCIYL